MFVWCFPPCCLFRLCFYYIYALPTIHLLQNIFICSHTPTNQPIHPQLQKHSVVAANNIPSALIKWFHGVNMGIVLATMATFGAFLGWKIRGGEGDIEFTGKTARELHPTLMGLAFLFFFLGGQGGLVLLDVQNQPILNSTHFVTGSIGIALLAFQGLLPKFFASENGEGLRTVHAYLGSATMLLLFVHAGFGLQLGNSF